jgi:superkiller protein 3
MRSTNSIALVVLCAGLVVGCASKDKSAQATSKTPDAPLVKTKFDTEKEPTINADTRFAAGQLAESREDRVNAMKQYEEAVKLKPDHVRALYRLGVVQAELKLYPKAIEMWKRYVKATHESADGYANLGFSYELSGDLRAAEGAYQKGIAKDAKNQPCRVNYGLMLARQDRMTDAVTNLRAVLSPAEVAYNIGSVHELRGKKEQAKAEYQRALSIDPGFSDAKQRLAALE